MWYTQVMGRGIAFDYDKAIQKAILLFRKSGYARTSVRDLQKAMKIGEGSFYNSLKSKKNLYLECLKQYGETVGRKRADALFSQPSIKLGIRALLRTVLDECDHPGAPRLCLFASSISSDVLSERELREFIKAQLAAFKTEFIKRLEIAKEAGELPAKFDPEAAVGIISTFMQGLLREVLLQFDRKQFERQIDVLLSGLGL
jgi:TetR/AcrR family transcriptional regulator, transcriptional repressor for nem operon